MFVNHQYAKLVLDDPAMSVLPVYVLLFLAAVLSIKKSAGQVFLDAGQTGQLKGLAILMIVAGHINLILAGGIRVPNFSGFGVSAFLFCSGYGLAVSTSEKIYTLKSFFTRRASRIYLPYWLVTAAIIAADYFVLSSRYPASGLALTMLGVNFTGFTDQFDPSRWFVTYIIVLYVFFFISVSVAGGWKGRTSILFALVAVMDALLVVVNGYYPHLVSVGTVRHYIMYSLLFPAGCMAAAYSDEVRASVGRVMNGPALRAAAVLAVVVFFVLKTLIADPLRGQFDRSDMGSILVESALWQPAFAAFLLVSLAALAALNQAGLRSGFLLFVGGISYEVYLVHFVFMQRYDPLLYRRPFALWFLIFLAVVLFMAFLLNRSVGRVRRLLRLDAASGTERVV
ncbi:MAG: acyltransferase [Nitrospirae bacterium]|nr:acyltransferase [Nitrospirota bacterium]